MHLQAILHCIDFWKTLSLWYLSTSRYYWVRALITVAFSFILCHFFRVGKAEDIYLFRSIHLFCVPCLYEPSLESQSTVSKEVHEVSTRSYWGVFCHSALLWDISGGVTLRLMESAGEGGAQVAAPGPLLWEVSLCFSAHQLCALCAAACCLPWGLSTTSFL